MLMQTEMVKEPSHSSAQALFFTNIYTAFSQPILFLSETALGYMTPEGLMR